MTYELPFKLAQDIVDAEDEEADYIVEQFLIKEAITSFSARIKGGKTTFIGATLRAIFDEEPIIGLRTRPAKVLYCTEEGPKSFKKFLQRTGLDATEDKLHVLSLSQIPREWAWRVVAEGVLGYATKHGADVVIFDTLTRWAKIRPDQENDAGAAAMAMEPLEMLRAAHMAVCAVFHDRKSGGDLTDSMRGSSAFGGAADILFSLINPGTNGHPNRRQLQSVGRFDDPGLWVMDWEDGRYKLIGEGVEAEDMRYERDSMSNKIVEVLETYMVMSGPGLAESVGVKSGNGTFQRALKSLQDSGRVITAGGSGRGKGNAKLYQLVDSITQ